MTAVRNSRIRRTIFLMFIVVVLCPFAYGKIIYVDDDATGANDGSSWADAYNYLQDALADANSAEKPVEIRVAQGVYKPDQGANQTPGDREATFKLIDGVTLKGGYAGVGEPDTNARAINVYETILSGDLNGNDIDVNDPQDLWYEPTRSDNSYHVVSSTGKDETAILDGLTITGGSSDMRSSPHNRGGGMFNQNGSPTLNNCTFRGNWAHWWSNGSGSGAGGGMSNVGQSSPTLTNCTFSGNSAGNGGGMHNSDSGPTLTNCIFTGNSSRHTAGGILNNDGSNSRLTNCTFFGNSSGSGGGICNYRSSPTITNCTFTDNRVRSSGGGVSNNQDSNPTLTNCKISGNTAGVVGGSYGRGGGMYNRDKCSPTLTNCTIIGNYSTRRGGGIYNEREGSPILTNCRITGNTAGVAGVSSGGGGGIYNKEGSSPTLTNCIITGNSAEYSNGGGMFNMNSGLTSSPTLINCTFADNSAAHGSALACDSRSQNFPSTVRLTNCILWENGNKIWNNDSSTITITFSNVKGLIGGRSGLPNGNINEEPYFIQTGHWDANQVWVDGDYHLKSQAGRWTSASSVEPDPNSQSWVQDDVTSPCIDAGDPMVSIGHEPFPNGGVINMGAYGGMAEASKSYFGEPVCETVIAGDINGDCKVDFKDFAIMALHWLEER